MRYRSLGSSGLLVSVVGLGCNNFGRRLDLNRTRAVIDAAIDVGITLFDTAESYGGPGVSESLMGEVLGGRRDQIVLATKWGNQKSDMGYGPVAGAKGGRAYIKRAVTGSLRRLRTDYIDLYQLHTPDPATPIDETIMALEELITEGKVRYIGHSNFSGWQLADAEHVARELGRDRFISAQNEWSLLDRVEALIKWADGQGVSILEVAIGGLAALPGCASVIAGATSPEQVKANAAAGDWIPDGEQLAELDKIVPPPPAGR